MDLLGRGMDGEVFALGGGLVAKVWFRRSEAAVRALAAFYEELRAASLPFATPQIHEVRVADGRVVSIERELTGTPLQAALDAGVVSLAGAKDCALLIVEALATTTGGPAAEALPVLDEAPLWSPGGTTWGAALAGVLRRQVYRYGDQLRPVVTDFAAKVDRVAELLAGLPDQRAVVHGDLCLPNVLVDDTGAVTAVLDWGFLSTRGDAAFDASTFAGFFDMFGPDVRKIDDELTDRFCARFGYPRKLLLLYRAFYALIGSNAYDPTGQDGHFAWCVATLNRKDVSAALLD